MQKFLYRSDLGYYKCTSLLPDRLRLDYVSGPGFIVSLERESGTTTGFFL